MTKLRESYDAIVIGCGPAGATTAFHLAARGRRVLALERHAFPRYHIGESLTSIVAQLIDDMDLRGEMDRRRFVPKSGVKVIGRDAKSEFFVAVPVPTWQVRRDAFDEMLLERAKAAGAEHRQGSVKGVLREDGRVVGVSYRPEGSDVLRSVRAPIVVDASGQGAVLSKLGVAGPKQIDAFGHQIAVFTQVNNAQRDAGEMGNNTVIFYAKKYHWSWFIPLSDDTVSVGIVLPTETYKQVATTPEDLFRWGIENVNPELSRRMRHAVAVEPIRTIANYSYRINPFVGPGWMCVGDAHRFCDPVFSFGIALGMNEGVAAAAAIDDALGQDDFDEPMRRFVAFSKRGHSAAYDLIRYFWRYPAFFPYQAAGDYRRDMMRLFGGDFFATEEIPALSAMRKSLRTFDAGGIVDACARSIAGRVQAMYGDFQGVKAAYLDGDDNVLCVSVVLADDRLALYEHLYELERVVRAEAGERRVAVRAYASDAATLRLVRQIGGATFGKDLSDAKRIFDHRAGGPR